MFNNPYNYYPYMNMTSPAMNIGRMNAFTPNMMGAATGHAPTLVKGGILKSLSGIKWGEVLNNTQKTLNVINQAIPVYYQVKPIFSNVKSFSRLLTAFNSSDENIPQNKSINNNLNNDNVKKENSTNSPTFFIN